MKNIQEPDNFQAEREVLASCLMDQERAKEITRQLTPADFHAVQRREIFSAVKVLVDRGNEVTTAGVLEVLNNTILPTCLMEIIKEFIPFNDRTNIKILKDNTYLRQLMKTTRLIYDRATVKDYTDLEVFKAEVEKSISDLKSDSSVNINELLESSAKRAEEYFEESVARDEGPLGYGLGPEFKETEVKMDGLQQGMYLLGGPPNTGKTSFLTNLSWNSIENNQKLHVAFFSMDDHARKVYFRLLAGMSRKPINYVSNLGARLLKNAKLDKEQKAQCFKEIIEAKKRVDITLQRLHIFDIRDGGDIGFIDETVRMLKRKYKDLFVIIDGLSKVQIKGFKGDATARVGELSQNLKKITNENNIPLIATTELRKLNHQGPPCMDDLRDSSQLAYDADVVLLAHNPWSVVGADEYRIGKAEVNGRMIEFISPKVVMNFAKNKLSGYRGNIDLILVPDLAIVTEENYFNELDKAEKLFEKKVKK